MAKSIKKISMKDIAEKLELSKNAVSLALNGKPGVSEETRDLVLKMAAKLGYKNGLNKESLSTDKILVILPEYIKNDSFFYNDVYWAIENNAKKKGYIAILSIVTLEMQENNQLPQICDEMIFAGIITIGVLNSSYVLFLQSRNINITSVDNYYYDLNVNSVVTANIEGAYKLTKLALDNGHEKIGFIGSITATSSIYDRYCGYKRALIEVDNHSQCGVYDILDKSPLSVLHSDADELYKILTNSKTLPTVWICGGDRMAIALIEAIKCMGYTVPEDFSVLGFDDLEISSMISPPLTTMRVDRKRLGKIGVERLIALINKQSSNTITCVETTIIHRDSLKNISIIK